MTLMLQLPPAAEGRAIEEVAGDILIEQLDPIDSESEQEREEIGRALEESMADIAAGRVLTLEESRAQSDAILEEALRTGDFRPLGSRG